ncbi:glycoside hydrolase family 130 protein [Aeoliella sp. ICT_H6.2]|uniref:Glycoside hydrolase family 130 protein n=1 Tax=Aeoliella straminimaris TaxID=2954799 RepID=A0A9X2F8M9_9BACT|nr:glycoside hydrolase family 130 protein [Aeoliella straminimaris]
MLPRRSERLVLKPEDVQPSTANFKVIGVFNPGAVRLGNEIVLLARVSEQPSEHRPDVTGLPRLGSDGAVVVDWLANDNLDRSDSRVVRRKDDGLQRLTSISHLRVFRSHDGKPEHFTVGPKFLPQSSYEEYGVEDPRITRLDGKYWITYVAVSRFGAATALASTVDFVTFERHGLIFYPDNKDVVLFPHKVQGKYVSLHRPSPSSRFSRPQIWLAYSADLMHWGNHEPIYAGSEGWESDRVGAGAPPIAIDEGWLEIYHGSRQATRAGEVGAYSAGALLLDRNDPTCLLRRSRGVIMQPSADFEKQGFVPSVVFPTALIDAGDLLHLYYGAADTCVGVVQFSRHELLEALQ